MADSFVTDEWPAICPTPVVTSRFIMTTKELRPQLKEFIERVIVLALVRAWLEEEKPRRPRALPAYRLTTEGTGQPAEAR
jgi:hypothetical protein